MGLGVVLVQGGEFGFGAHEVGFERGGVAALAALPFALVGGKEAADEAVVREGGWGVNALGCNA